jgi:hypothetical protein
MVVVGLAAWIRPAPTGADDSAGTVVKLGPMQARAPGDWKSEKSQFNTRLYQFRLPRHGGDAEDAEVTVSHFGANQGGSLNENLQRWKGQFVPPPGKAIDDVAKTEKLKLGDAEATYLNVEGTYKSRNPPFDPNAKEVQKPGWRLLAVYVPTKEGPYFIRCIGPAQTVEHFKKGFDDWLRSFR